MAPHSASRRGSRQWRRVLSPNLRRSCSAARTPQGEGQNGEQIVQGLVQLPLGQVDPHQDDVAGLRGGKDLAAVEIAVPVQQTAGQSQQKADWKRFRGLELFHGCTSFRNPAQKDTTSFDVGQGQRNFFEKIYRLSCFWRRKE